MMRLFGLNIDLSNQGLWLGRSSLTNVTQFYRKFISGNQTEAGELVNEDTAMRLSAVFACVRVLSETAAQVPLYYYQRTDSGKAINTDDPRNQLVNEEPNGAMDSFTFRESMTFNLNLHGNAYARIIRDGNGTPTSLLPVVPENIKQIRISEDGQRIFYTVKLSEDKEQELPERDILHFKILSKDGYIGRSVIDTAREELGGALATQRFSNNFWQNGAAPGLVVKMPHQLSQEAYERLKTSLQNFKGGNAGKSLPLDQNADVQEVGGIPQRDAQFLETKKFSKEQIASLFRVPLPLINSLDNANYSNVTALTLNFAKYTMAPLFARMEAELNRKLRPRTEAGRKNFFEFDMTSLMRGDDATRAEYFDKLFGNSVITPNEIREREGLNRLDVEGMDKPYKQKQDIPIDQSVA